MQNLVPSFRPVPDFTPVPRKYRYDGWTAERQRGFIAALAETGSVKAAAKRINMSPEGAYFLRRQPGADSFRAAWESALDHGVQRLVDIAIDRATEGVSVPIFWRGEQVGEKRWYNDRLLMFVLRHHLPDRYGTSLRPGTRHPDTIAREAAENCPVCEAREAGEPDKADDDKEATAKILRNYESKVRAERHYRLTGQIVAADYALRQLTHIELILACGGKAMELIDLWTRRPTDSGRGTVELEADPLSEMLEEIRRKAWEAVGDPPRPPLPLDRRECMGSGLWSGPTMREREKARQAAEAKMARAQREWEAAQREDSWAAWKGADG
ncbi:MAG: hypothetical protein V4459_10540 [Pseudomonadota bacterium]